MRSSQNLERIRRMKISAKVLYKWVLIFKLTALYGVLAPGVMIIVYYAGLLNLELYKQMHQELFYPWNRFPEFFRTYVWIIPILEESWSRGPVWLLSISGLNLNNKYVRLLAVILVILPSASWAVGHPVLVLPVFAAGIGWGWLVFKTRSLWPAIVAHGLSNTLIYLGIKLTGLFLQI